MSIVRDEYKLQSVDAYLSKNLDVIRLENQELKLAEHSLR